MKKIFSKLARKPAAPPPPPYQLTAADEQLLDKVQRETLKYFWDFGHPVSGMARERSNVVPEFGYDLNCVTTGGTGFGVMAMIAGVERGWIKRDEFIDRLSTIVDFLDKTDKFHGAFPHFLNGNTGKTIPFSPKDDGGDLVETSFLIMGLLSAREYLAKDANNIKAAATSAKITQLWEGVEWDWYTKGTKDLYWHWSPNHNFDMNLPIKGWNECLVTHVLAASSPTHPVSADVYKKSWTKGAEFKNGTAYGGIYKNGKPENTIELPLGPALGGPLFFTHYSFMGLNPKQLQDRHADYFEQNRNHALLNRAHCINNPLGYKGYGPDCWGLTACDSHEIYNAHSPANDRGVIAPTAALASMPYTPKESMDALRHFDSFEGSRLWGKYGLVDSFSESNNWTAKSHLAIDQGPIVVMIENHRSGLLWDLCMGMPEISSGLKKLGFTAQQKAAPVAAPKPPKP